VTALGLTRGSSMPPSDRGRPLRRGALGLVVAALLLLPVEIAGRAIPIEIYRGPCLHPSAPSPVKTARDGQRHLDWGRGPDGVPVFLSQQWQATAPPEVFRIVALGDSTVKGSLPGMLADGLRIPQRRVEVLNFGVGGFGSHQTRRVAEEALAQDPDLVLVYVGHNEVIADRACPDTLLPPWRQGLRKIALGSGIARMLDAAVVRHLTPQPIPLVAGWPESVCGAMTEGERSQVAAHYRENLEAICESAVDQGVPIALVEPSSSLQYPRNLEVAAGLYGEELGSLPGALDWIEQGRALEALTLADQLATEFPLLGEPHLVAGLALVALGQRGPGLERLQRARRDAALPERTQHFLTELLPPLALDCGAILVTTEQHLLSDPRALEPGDPLFQDHVHPSFQGNLLLAQLIVDQTAAVLPTGARFDLTRLERGSYPALHPHGWRPTNRPPQLSHDP
jgi:lysophospholipase L1-like esterase